MVQLIAALVGLIKSIPTIDRWFGLLVAAWINGQTDATISQIGDAASQASSAKTDEERFKAAEAWRKALSRPRVIP